MGQIVSIEEQEIAGLKLELFVISFEKDKMTLRVPTAKATESRYAVAVVARHRVQGDGHAQGQGQGEARPCGRGRAQEYEQKINSGDLISIAEVVRDLHRADDQREQSYSERQALRSGARAADA